MNKQTLIIRIKKILANRRVVYFSKYTDPKMQQVIKDAERVITFIQSQEGNTFKNNIKRWANDYLVPLIPSTKSPMHNSITNTYNQIINL